MRPDYCPIGGQPCQSLCDTPCTTPPQRIPQAVTQIPQEHSSKPKQRQPLMDAELERLYDAHAKYQEYGAWVSGWFEFARAIEAAHGIKGEE